VAEQTTAERAERATSERKPPDLSAIDVVSWDVDGTLYRLPVLVREVKRLARRRLLSWRFIPALWQLHRLRTFLKEMDVVRRRGGVLEPGELPADRDVLLRLEEHWYSPALSEVGPWDGVVELLDLFAARGLRQVVASDYEAAHKLEALGLAGRFEALFSGEALGHLKPSPEIFRHMSAELGVPPGRILHLGDRPETDGIAASKAGCRVLIFDRGFVTPRELYDELGG